METCRWKKNWADTRERMLGWWEQRSFLLSLSRGWPRSQPRSLAMHPPKRLEDNAYFLTGASRAEVDFWELAAQEFPLDSLPISAPDLGGLSLPMLLGAEAKLQRGRPSSSVASFRNIPLEELPEHLRLDDLSPAWQSTTSWIARMQEINGASVFLAPPELVCGFETLLSLRGSASLSELTCRSSRTLACLKQLRESTLSLYESLHQALDAGSGQGYPLYPLQLWSDRPCIVLHSAAATVLSPKQIDRLMLPHLQKLSHQVPRSILRVQSLQVLPVLQRFLELDDLTAFSFQPRPGEPPAYDPCWFASYRQVLDHGKSLQLGPLPVAELPRLLNQCGQAGLCVHVDADADTDLAELRALGEALPFQLP